MPMSRRSIRGVRLRAGVVMRVARGRTRIVVAALVTGSRVLGAQSGPRIMAPAESPGVVLERAYGMTDVESGVPMSPSTVVHAASLAKQVTALSVLLLVRDGKLSLDDDVRRWFPELLLGAGPITVRQLLGHAG
jgi:CubicO group peptidase (beta-lactamase class C family)